MLHLVRDSCCCFCRSGQMPDEAEQNSWASDQTPGMVGASKGTESSTANSAIQNQAVEGPYIVVTAQPMGEIVNELTTGASLEDLRYTDMAATIFKLNTSSESLPM